MTASMAKLYSSRVATLAADEGCSDSAATVSGGYPSPGPLEDVKIGDWGRHV